MSRLLNIVNRWNLSRLHSEIKSKIAALKGIVHPKNNTKPIVLTSFPYNECGQWFILPSSEGKNINIVHIICVPLSKSSEVTTTLNELKTENHIENITVCHSSHITYMRIFAYRVWHVIADCNKKFEYEQAQIRFDIYDNIDNFLQSQQPLFPPTSIVLLQ